MKRATLWLSVFIFSVLCLTGRPSAAETALKMATTTSTQASGLLDVLLPEFYKDSGIRVKVIAKGTGAALRDGMDGNVDVIFVHAKEREETFIKDGYGTKRYPVMHNDFVIVGPPTDPAAIRGMTDAALALKKIAARNALFVSRGDDSGTHTKEQYLWKLSGLTLEQKTEEISRKGKLRSITFVHPAGLGKWYLSIGQGMGKALMFADEKQTYVLADRGTFLKYTLGRDLPIDLQILCEGDPRLANPYGVIPVNPEKYPHVKFKEAQALAHWLVSARGQTLIDNYKLLGKQLFFADALAVN